MSVKRINKYILIHYEIEYCLEILSALQWVDLHKFMASKRSIKKRIVTLIYVISYNTYVLSIIKHYK